MIISKSLIKNCIKRDPLAQKDLYSLLLPYLNVVVERYLYNNEDKQDVLQEAFINIFNNIDKYDNKRSQFKTWAVKITINCSLKNNAKRGRNRVTVLDDNKHGGFMNPEVIQKLSEDDLLSILKTMPESYFQVFNLFVIDEFSHNEISQALNINVSLSRKRLSRAREWLVSNKNDTDLRNMLIEKMI